MVSQLLLSLPYVPLPGLRAGNGFRPACAALIALLGVACDGPKDDTAPQVEDTDEAIVDTDGDGVPDTADCDPADPYTYPGAHEVPYDGKDQDCNGADVTDYDGDGHDGADAGGDDCNDSNPDVHPGATIVCYDLLDETCVGTSWSQYDCDSDGYVVTEDCGDEDAAIHPGAADTWYDGIDSDCNASDDYDQDGDGFSTIESGGTDCDDLDAEINTDFEEEWDGRDNDCRDGADDLDSRDTTVSWYGDTALTEAGFGGEFLTLDDLDGDGLRDVVVGVTGYAKYTGRVYVLPYGEGREVPATAALATIEGTSGYLGSALGTVRGPDGGTLVAVAEVGGMVIHLFDPAAFTGGAVLTGADAVASITSDTYYLGGDLATWDDGAGGESLLVSSFEVADGGTYAGLFPGAALSGALDPTAATWSTTLSGDSYDANVLGDLDGDGLGEIGVASAGFSGTNRVSIYASADVEAGTDDPAALTGSDGHLILGGVPDLDGDGYDELLVSSWEADGGGTAAGLIRVIGGPAALAGGSLDDAAGATITGATDSGYLRACSGHGDLDGDGVLDLLVCVPGEVEGAVYGSVGWISGTAIAGGGDFSPGTTAPTFVSVSYGDLFGADALPEDIDGDGDLDLWVSAPSSPGSLTSYLRR